MPFHLCSQLARVLNAREPQRVRGADGIVSAGRPPGERASPIMNTCIQQPSQPATVAS
jgi:hypothetical protein